MPGHAVRGREIESRYLYTGGPYMYQVKSNIIKGYTHWHNPWTGYQVTSDLSEYAFLLCLGTIVMIR